jgi:hypothetical protein
VAPFWQGLDEHSLLSVAQLYPLNPFAHVHWYANELSVHVAPFWHG